MGDITKQCVRWDMANHVHLLICPKHEDYSISGILQSVKQPVARRAIEYVRTHRPFGLRLLATGQKARPYRFWQKGGGYDRNITSVATLVAAVRYIHGNPVRKGLVETADPWHYSSAADWEGVRAGAVTIDHGSFPTH